MYKNIRFRLTQPYNFEKIEEEIKNVPKAYSLVRPTLLSICNADLRYYTGKRREEDLLKKLPMALIHEGVGVVEYSTTYKKGDRVVIIPNIVEHDKEGCEICKNVGQNYCTQAKFLSSGHDGFTQKYLLHPSEFLVKIPQTIPENIAVFSELSAVVYNIYKRLDIKENNKIAFFGDGPIGYSFALYIKHLSKAGIYVVGKHKEKLQMFDFAKTLLYDNKDLIEILKNTDYVFECIGNLRSSYAINTGIKIAKPGSKIILVGVSEEHVPIDTRNILAKGLSLVGTSRSEKSDYEKIINYMQDSFIQEKLKKLIHKTFEVKSLEDLWLAFHYAKEKQYWGKILIRMSL
jgi:ribitol-5-phosphate 2-dehydrogenase